MAKKQSRLEELRQRAMAIWDDSIFRSGKEPTRLHKFIHFWVLVAKSFVRNRCPIRASALSYTTMLAMIPLLAVALSIAGTFLKKEGQPGIKRLIEHIVATVVPPDARPIHGNTKPITPLPELQDTNSLAALDANAPTMVLDTNSISENLTNFVAGASTNFPSTDSSSASNSASGSSNDLNISSSQETVAQKINEFIQNTQTGTLGITGTILLIFVAIRMLSSIESTFNDIWGATRGRHWFMQIVIYWFTICFGSMLLVGVLGLAGGSQFQTTRKMIQNLPLIGGLVFPVLTPVLIWILFAVFYKIVPNTKVSFRAAFVGGIIGGSLWHVNNVFGFLYASRVVSYSKLYGSLGLVPVFMVGIYFSWMILLFGAQVAYAFQNRTLYLQEKLAENVNQRGREFVALRLMTCIGQRFHRGLKPPTIQEISDELGIPSRLVQQVLQTLVAAHLVMEVSGAEPAYAPARPIDNITAHHVLQAMRATLGQELLTRDEPVRAEVYGEFARIQEAEKQAASAVSMLALVNRAEARLELTPPPPADEKEIKLTHALVPPKEEGPIAEPPVTTHEKKPISAEPSEPIEVAPAEPTPETKPSPTPQRIVSEPTSDDERDFPL